MKLDALLDPTNLVNIYTELQEASSAYFLAETKHVQAETLQRSWFVQAIAEGVIQGKNENEREGNGRVIRPDLYAAVEDSYAGMMQAKARMEVARLEERKVSLLMRACDLYVGLFENGHKGLEGIYPPTIPGIEQGADSYVTPDLEPPLQKG